MDRHIEEVTLTLSGMTIQWCPGDRTYRAMAERDAASEWTAWTGEVQRVLVRLDGDVWNRPGWCVLVGEIPTGRLNRKPTVRSADGNQIAAIRLGGLWIAEWIGSGEPVTIEFGRSGREIYCFVIRRPVLSDD